MVDAMTRQRCSLRIVALIVGYLVYLLLLFSPRTSEYVVKASLAFLFGALAYMAAMYLRASCSRPSVGSTERLTGTPVG